ncbi:prolyl 4-hydroxylase subunit alpha-1-like [Mya arenaria]|uniref:prolyl 4-hydroxylase subunit alpha-1-like n=1 Tax=Mya arenaria TaxID=6604 RepID=UPI0022DE9AD8|nr:prolyl 4-hydroxylase subunit alpha-1-like [Mya arenaria]
MRILILRIISIICLAHVTLAEKGAFTTYVNLEKLYAIEDELLTLSSVILSQERVLHGEDDVHGIFNISGTLDTVKDIHRSIVSANNVTSYIVNPINIFHLVKRLSRDWNKVIAVLEDSKSCAKVMRVKVDNMADNMPTGSHLKLVTEAILRMQALYDLSAYDVISGNVSNDTSLSPLSLDDAFDVARVAYETKQYVLAVDWLNFVTSNFDPDMASFSITNALNLLSSSNLKLSRPKEALRTIESILQLDPNNNNAKRNKEYILIKINEGMKETKINTPILRTKKDRLLQKFCRVKNENLAKGKGFCTYTRSRNLKEYFARPSIKTEVLSLRPLVVLYHDLTNTSQQKAVAHLGYEKMRDLLYKDHYTYPNGIDGFIVDDWTYWQWIPKLRETLNNIDLSFNRPAFSHFMVKNIGLEGYETTPLDQSERHLLGTFVVFLSEPSSGGGNIVFPFLNVTVLPQKGSVLFFERKAHQQMTVCPVLADTEWVGIYHLQDQMYTDVCYADVMKRPKRS